MKSYLNKRKVRFSNFLNIFQKNIAVLSNMRKLFFF